MANTPAHDKRNDIQFIVNDGIIYNKHDIMNILWDLGYITYFEVSGEKVTAKGKGFIMRVSANSEEGTLFLNGRIYINVNSVDYMRVRKIKEYTTLYELHCDKRIIKLVPDNKKHPMPPFRYVAEAVSELDMMQGEEFPPENFDEPPSAI